MRIHLHECMKGAPSHEQKKAAQQRRALKARFCEWRGVNGNLQKTAQAKLEEHIYGNANGKDGYKNF